MGLEIAPGNEVEENPELHKVGNAWNTIPVAKEWTPVDAQPGCIVVNIGDGLAWWSDGILKSTYHRVRSPVGSDPKARLQAYSTSATMHVRCLLSAQKLTKPFSHPPVAEAASC